MSSRSPRLLTTSLAPLLVVGLALAGCSSSGSSTPSPASSDSTSAQVSEATDTTTAPDGTGTGTEDGTGTGTGETTSAAASGDAVQVEFDTPGSDPRPLKETTADITGTPTILSMDIAGISYRGVVCGFTFRGSERPASPVKIRMTGTAGTTPFDSGEVDVAWTGDDVTAGGATDDAGGWNFLADATPSRNGVGWVVQLGAIPKNADTTELPNQAGCTLTGSAPFAAANGPVGYWAGFATR